MEQLSFFDPVDRTVPRSTWWSGNYQCRNWQGYYQTREGGTGPWKFVIYAFGVNDAVVYAIDAMGALKYNRVPIDARDRLLINGKRYGRRHWDH